MSSLVASVEAAVGVEDEDPGEFLAVYECIYGGKPPSATEPPADASDEAVKAFDALFAPAEPARMETAKERAAREAVLPPHVGRISVHKDAIHFKADMFGLDSTECTLMRWHVKRAEERSATYAVVLVDWHGAAHEFQLHRASGELYRLLVDAWELEEAPSRLSVALNPHVQDPNDPNSKLGRLNAEARNRARAEFEREKRSLLGRLRRAVAPAVVETLRVYRQTRDAYVEVRDYLFPPLPPPPPNLPTVDVKAKTNLCLFLSIVAAEDVLAMDDGGVSDPFAKARWGSLECTTEVVYETVNPEWNETFVFNLGACKDEIEEDITICLYDYDLALNDFIGFARVPIKGRRVSRASDWDPKPEWITIESLPEDYDSGEQGFDWGRVKDSLMFWEGKRTYTGRVKVATWVGDRSDLAMRTAQHPVMWRPTEPSRDEAKFYVEPHTAALHVLVRSGRDILPMDGSKDDPGGLSDPYCEVILEHEKSGKFETEQTHYIDDVDAPEWERKFSFVISRPYTQNTLWFKVYDFDGGFDELIGQVQIKCEDLDIHEGFDKPPPAKWLTLLDTSGNSKNSDGDPYGEILVSAYIDEEYLEHLHLQKVHAADEPKIGELEVDIFKIHDLPEDVASAGDVFCVVKYGPYWTRFPTKDAEDGQVAFDLRSLFPVLDMHVPVIVAAFAGEGDAPRLLGKIKVPAAALETNQRYFKVVDVSSLDASTGEVVRGGKLDLALTYRREARSSDGIWALARQYLKPTRSDKWYYNPIPENEQEKVAKRHKELVVNQLAANNPPVKESIAKEMLDFSRHEFNSRMIQTSIARLQCVAAEGLEVVAAVDDVFSWRNPYVTAFVQCVLFFMINYPRLIVPGILFLVGSVPCAMFWTRKKRAFDQIAMDFDVSVGKLPPRLDILLNGAALTNEEIKALERENQKREQEALELEMERRKAEEEKQRRDEAESAEAVAAILAEADAESDEDSDEEEAQAPKMAGSMNPFTNLMRQYEELTTMITSIQTIMDDVATVAEQVLGVLTWREPRVTFVATCALMSASVGYFFSHVVFDVVVAAARLYASNAAEKTSRAATSVVGKVVETVTERANAVWERYFEHAYATLEHAVVSSTRETVGALLYVWSFFTLEAVFRALRFAASVYMLYALRHPSVFPDESAAFKNAAKGGGPGVDEASEADRKEGSNANDAKGPGDEANANGDAAGKENAPPPEAEPPRKKSKAELEAEAERERRRAARAAKKAERRKAKEAEEEAKKAKAAGASMIDPRPAAPVNALLRIPSRGYQIL